MKRQSLHVKDNAIYDHFTKQQVIWTHGYGATDRYVTRNEWGALLLQWPVLFVVGIAGGGTPGYLFMGSGLFRKKIYDSDTLYTV